MSSASDSLKKLVRFLMRDVSYHKHYYCTVVSQSGGKVDLLPQDPSIQGSGLSGIPIYNGLPGVAVTVLPGADAILFYENGDPSKPRARITGSSSIDITFNNGLMPIARVGDTITGTSATGGPVTGIIAGGAPTLKA